MFAQYEIKVHFSEFQGGPLFPDVLSLSEIFSILQQKDHSQKLDTDPHLADIEARSILRVLIMIAFFNIERFYNHLIMKLEKN